MKWLLCVILCVSAFALLAEPNRSESVIVINPIEVPEGREKEALAIWDRYAAYFRKQPGYIGTTLHESLDPTSKFHYINVAEWKSAEAFMKAPAER